ncbi:CONSTANS-like protein, partial [Trifolium medium]|nr:CONSTANS-like protein [Trifolium medium]
ELTRCPSVHEIVSALGLDLKPHDAVFVKSENPSFGTYLPKTKILEQVCK